MVSWKEHGSANLLHLNRKLTQSDVETLLWIIHNLHLNNFGSEEVHHNTLINDSKISLYYTIHRLLAHLPHKKESGNLEESSSVEMFD